VQLADHYAIALAAGMYDDLLRLGPEPQPQHDKGDGVNDPGHGLDDGDAGAIPPAQQIQVATPTLAPQMLIQRQYLPAQRHDRSVDSLQSLQQHPSRAIPVRSAANDPVDDASQKYRNNDSVFTISVTAALRDRLDEATPVIMAELKQMLDKHVCV
jgi:hypothetical protein